VESERALPCPDVAWFSAAKLSVGKIAAFRSQSGAACTAAQRRFKGGLFVSSFSNATEAAILITT
jgi:hypothetical protein